MKKPFNKSLLKRIKQIHNEYVLYVAAYNFFCFVLTVSGLLLIAILMQLVFPLMQGGVSFALSIVFYVAMLILLLGGIYRVISEGKDLSSIIGCIQRYSSSLAEKVISAIQLELNVKECRTLSSKYMAEMFSLEVLKEMESLSVIKLFGTSRLFIILLSTVATLSIVLLVCTSYPKEMTVAIKRVLLPFKNLPNVYGAVMDIKDVNNSVVYFTLPSTNIRDITIEYKGITQQKTVPVFYDKEKNVLFVKIMPFETLQCASLIEYRLKFDKAYSMWLTITNSYFALEAFPPLYTRLPSIKHIGTNFLLKLPCHSTIKLQYNYSEAATNLMLLLKNSNMVNLIYKTNSNVITGHFVLTNSGLGELMVKCNRKNKTSFYHKLGVFHLYQDAPPKVEWLEETNQVINAAAVDSFLIRLKVSDDFGIDTVKIYISKTLKDDQSIYFTTNLYGISEGEIAIPIDTAAFWQEHYTSMCWRAVVLDNFPILYGGQNSVTSSPIYIELSQTVLPYNCQKIRKINSLLRNDFSSLKSMLFITKMNLESLSSNDYTFYLQNVDKIYGKAVDFNRMLEKIVSYKLPEQYWNVQARIASINEFLGGAISREIEALRIETEVQKQEEKDKRLQHILRLIATSQEAIKGMEDAIIKSEKTLLLSKMLNLIAEKEKKIIRNTIQKYFAFLCAGIYGFYPNDPQGLFYELSLEQREIRICFVNWIKELYKLSDEALINALCLEYLTKLSDIMGDFSFEGLSTKQEQLIKHQNKFGTFKEDFLLNTDYSASNKIKEVLQLQERFQQVLWHLPAMHNRITYFSVINSEPYNYFQNTISPQASQMELLIFDELENKLTNIISLLKDEQNKNDFDMNISLDCYWKLAEINKLLTNEDIIVMMASLVNFCINNPSFIKTESMDGPTLYPIGQLMEVREKNFVLSSNAILSSSNFISTCPEEYRNLVENYMKKLADRDRQDINK